MKVSMVDVRDEMFAGNSQGRMARGFIVALWSLLLSLWANFLDGYKSGKVANTKEHDTESQLQTATSMLCCLICCQLLKVA